MIRKYHSHTLQTSLKQREEEPQNTDCRKKSGRQLGLSNPLSLSPPNQDDCKPRWTQIAE